MRTVQATHRSKVIELLRERLAFEQAIEALYGAVLDRLASRSGPFESVRAHLRRIREEEKAHAEWLGEQLRTLGGAPEGDDLPFRGEWRRIADRIEGEADPGRLFCALRDAEIADTSGWELLRELAERAQDEEARDAFEQRLREEYQHLLFANRLAAVFANSEILDQSLTTIDEPAVGAHSG